MVFQENDIDYILSHLNEPDTLVDEEFQTWLQEPEHLQLFEEIRNHREAFMRLRFDKQIDVDKEYKRLETKILPSRKLGWMKWGIAAACMVLFFSVFALLVHSRKDLPEGELAAIFEGKKSAELILASGERINLENNVIELRESNGMLVVNDSNYCLSYRKDTLSVLASERKELTYNVISVPAGADYMVTLADGTKVQLNCETKLRFPVEFAGNERKVFLDGEAFFEVEKAKDWPFIVVTSKMKVQVTGTRFNIKSYRNEDLIHTTLVSGLVEVQSDLVAATPVRLTPSQQYRLNKRTNEVEVKNVDVSLYTDWTEGMFVFKNQRLEEVMNTLARWYTVEVFYVGTSVKDLRLSANLGRYEHIDSLLEVIRAMDKVNIQRKGSVVTISQK